MKELDKNYAYQSCEEKWINNWEDQKIYHWNPHDTQKQTFAIDTPPPTVSGSLHIGHVFSYTQTDVIARYLRMIGKNVFYPMGWDDNGLPTERRVQHVFNIKCNPLMPYNPDWKPEKKQDGPLEEVSRLNFIQACNLLTQEDEKIYEWTWKKLGLSIDWNQQYATIDSHCRKISQWSFLDLLEKKKAYKKYAVTLWDVDFKTAVAQAEIEDRMKPGVYHDIAFQTVSGHSFVISTTRPELLPACIAIAAHPEDKRYQHLFQEQAITPLYHHKVPILPSDHADPEKGTGILMVCTFGDIQDVHFWKKHQLPLKQVITQDGTFINSQALDGLKVPQARKKIVSLLEEQQLILAKKPVEHAVKFYEKGDSPIEFMPTYQWFINILDEKDDLLAQGEKLNWVPTFMKHRYKSWVEGLNQDWCISRQRYFGVPFPVWYSLNDKGEIQYENPILPTKDQLPIDPMTDTPQGFSPSQRHQPNGFVADPDVMDTWATSSLTPQLMSHWQLNPERHRQLFPMQLRPQSHEIIRTWAFYTIAKAWMHEKKLPWETLAISGWVLDPDRKKMSKSKGNTITPLSLIDTYSADALRYWACKARLGIDTTYDETVFAIGKRLATKLFNASKFAMIQIKESCFDKLNIQDITHPTDLNFLSLLNQLITKSTQAFEVMDYASALDQIETTFWTFCDDYIELVKIRAYRDETLQNRRSAIATLSFSLDIFLKLFAPYLPFITEEIYHHFKPEAGSVHQAKWPQYIPISTGSEQAFEWIKHLLSEIRSVKTKAQKTMKHPIQDAVIFCHHPDVSQVLQTMATDIQNAGHIEHLTIQTSPEITYLKLDCTLATIPT